MATGMGGQGYLLKDIDLCLMRQVSMIDLHLRYLHLSDRNLCHIWERGTAPLQILEEQFLQCHSYISCCVISGDICKIAIFHFELSLLAECWIPLSLCRVL